MKSETRNVKTVRRTIRIEWGRIKRWAFECATTNSDRLRLCRFAGYRVDCRTVRKQVHRVESRMEYRWELRSKNAQNIKALMCPLYKNSPLRERGTDRFARADTQSINQEEVKWWRCGGVMSFFKFVSMYACRGGCTQSLGWGYWTHTKETHENDT